MSSSRSVYAWVIEMIVEGEIYFYLKDEKHGWLSNFYPSPFLYYDRELWPTNEHFYQAQKARRAEFREWIRKAPNPYHAMLAGRALRPEKDEAVDDWEKRKLDVMRTGLREKFAQNPELKRKLLDTGDMPIHENSPYDSFWGNAVTPDGKPGKDWLGKLLMETREEMR